MACVAMIEHFWRTNFASRIPLVSKKFLARFEKWDINLNRQKRRLHQVSTRVRDERKEEFKGRPSYRVIHNDLLKFAETHCQCNVGDV